MWLGAADRGLGALWTGDIFSHQNPKPLRPVFLVVHRSEQGQDKTCNCDLFRLPAEAGRAEGKIPTLVILGCWLDGCDSVVAT